MSNKYHDLNAVAAYMNFAEFAWECVECMFEDEPNPKDVDEAIFLALEASGIKVEDKKLLLKSLPYYYTEGADEVDGLPGGFLEGPDFGPFFEKVGIT